MPVPDVGAAANALHNQLTEDFVFPIPEIDLSDPQFQLPYDPNSPMYAEIPKLTVCDLTSREVGGTGVFDALMESVSKHLKEEYDAGRITGAEYTKSYIAATEASMASATQFLLNRDQAYWQAVTAQIGAVTARVQMEVAKAQLMQTMYGAMREKAGFALVKMQTLVSNIEFQTQEFVHENMQPIQLEILEKQSAGVTLQNEGVSLDNETKDFNLSSVQPAQLRLISEQTEAARAQTMDTRTDGVTPIVGSVGKQKALYDQQITSYQRKSEMDAAKLWSDAWTVQKTIDEGLTAPTNFTNSQVDQVLSRVRTANGLV